MPGGSLSVSPGVSLTWAQRAMLEILTKEPRPDDNHNITLAVRVRGGPTTAQALERLRLVLERHEGLRSTVSSRDAVQETLPPEAVEVIPHALDDVSADRLTGLAQALKQTPLGLGGRPCARIDLVTCEGAPHTALFTFSHLGIDGGALEPLRAEVTALLAGRTPAGAPLRPRERAAFEHSPAGRERSARALIQAGNVLRERVPTAFPPRVGPPSRPRHWIGRLDSATIGPAAALLAARHRLSASALLVGVLTAMLGLRAREPLVPLLVIVGNRFEPELRGYVGPLSQTVPVNIPVEAGSVLATARQAGQRLVRAYTRGQFEPLALAGLLREVQERRGVVFDMPTMVNIHPSWSAAWGEPLFPVPAEESSFTWESKLDGPHLPHFYLNVFPRRGRTSLHLEVDTARVGPEAAEAFLRGIEAVIAELLRDDLTLDAARALAGPWDPFR